MVHKHSPPILLVLNEVYDSDNSEFLNSELG